MRRWVAVGGRVGLVVAACGFLVAGWALPGASAHPADPSVTGAWNVTVKVDTTKSPVVVSGTATFTSLTKDAFYPATVTLTIAPKSGALDPKCKITNPYTASNPTAKGDSFAATLDAKGAFSIPVTVACAGSFTATVTASNPPSAAAAIPNTGQGATPFDYAPPTAGTGALPPRSNALPPANKPLAPPIPALPGSKAASAGGSGPAEADAFDSSITYPGNSSSGGPSQLANDNNGSGRELNKRLLASCGAGVLLAVVVAAQLFVLNMRGRRLEEANVDLAQTDRAP